MPQEVVTLTVTPNNVYVTGTFHNNSDSALKDDQKEVREEETMAVLRAVSPKTYRRNDLQGQSRIGFVAQDIEGVVPPEVVPPEWTNLVGESTNEAGQTIKGLDYARLIAILWACCKNLDARVKQLESAQ